MVSLAARLDLDRKAIRCMQRLRQRYAPGPLMVPMPGRPRAVILEPDQVRRVLDQSPDPFATDSSEKRAALAHFEPQGVLISRGAVRTDRRRFNEAVLQPERPMHAFSERFVFIAEQEGRVLLDDARRNGALTWRQFAPVWFRMVRQIVFGKGARDDEQLIVDLEGLRSAANWALFHPVRHRLRTRFFERLRRHLARAEPGSLAGLMSRIPASADTAPDQQVPQWLFAFDAAGMATFRALALLLSHSDELARGLREVNEPQSAADHPHPFLRATILEAVRLWPTTPLVLRQTTRETEWDAGVMPGGTGVLIYAPYFHRDDQRLSWADRFTPELWRSNESLDAWPLIPFSRGPASCPGEQLVLLLGSAILSLLIRSGPIVLTTPRQLGPAEPLPGTLNHFELQFAFPR
jgi:cytochrome P450